MHDCNNCEHISITEEEQLIIYETLGIFKQHYCMKYRATLNHKKEGKKRIRPCDKCRAAK